MKEKIFETLKGAREQNSQVSDRTLEGLAEQYSKLITTDEQLGNFDAKGVIENLQGNINFVLKTEADKLQAKHNEELKKLEEERKKLLERKPPEKQDDEPNLEVKSLKEQLEKLTTQMQDLQAGAVKEGRLAKLRQAYAGMPKGQLEAEEALYDSVYGNMNTDTFNAVIAQREAANKVFIEQAKANGLDFSVPSRAREEHQDWQTPVLKQARELVNKQKQKSEK